MRRGMILGVAACALASAAALAQNVILPGTGATSLAQERQALLAANRQAQQARQRSADLQRQAAQATQDADRARRAAAALAAKIQASEADIQAAQARIAIVRRLQRVQSARLAERQQPIVRLTAALQMLARRPAALALVQPGSITDAVHMRMVLGSILPVIRERTAGLRQELDRSRQLRMAAEQSATSLRDSRTRLATQQADLRKLETAKRLASQGLRSTASIEGDRAIALGERARDIVDLMNELEAAGAVRARLETLPGPSMRPQQPSAIAAPSAERATAMSGPPPYRLPAIGALVTGLGEISDSGARSRGLTIATQPGAQIVAPTAGRIAFADHYRGYGDIVIIDHGQGWTSLITGLGRLSIEVGAQVAQGDPVGAAAVSAQPKVTVELRRNGRPVDIVPLIRATS